jgi:hypothetical protein
LTLDDDYGMAVARGCAVLGVAVDWLSSDAQLPVFICGPRKQGGMAWPSRLASAIIIHHPRAKIPTPVPLPRGYSPPERSKCCKPNSSCLSMHPDHFYFYFYFYLHFYFYSYSYSYFSPKKDPEEGSQPSYLAKAVSLIIDTISSTSSCRPAVRV